MKSLLTILLLHALLMTQAAAADDVLARIRERDRLIVSVKNDGNPARAAHKDPAHFNKRDFELAIARAVAAKLLGDPAKLEIRLMRKPERVPAVVDGRVDLAISMLRPSAGLRAQVDFSRPYFETSSAVMQGVDGAIRTVADFGGRRIGVIARNDAKPQQAFEEIGGGKVPAQIVEFDSFGAAAEAIMVGEIDALLSESVNIAVYLADHPAPLFRSKALSRAPVAVAVPKENPALLQLVNAVIDELEASGELVQLQQTRGLLLAPTH
jgi:aspartate/glutamate/glutamine transport system substrate-binding protein